MLWLGVAWECPGVQCGPAEGRSVGQLRSAMWGWAVPDDAVSGYTRVHSGIAKGCSVGLCKGATWG